MSNELALYKLSDMQVMAEAVARSGLFGMKSADQALALMLVAQSENMHPATVTQDYDIIQGKACRKTHSVMARFQQMGGKVEWHILSESIADATFSHPAGGALRISWTIEQAKKAGLTNKDNWKNYPRAMLRARTIAEGVRSVYPAAIGGMMIAEEAQDMGEKEINPASQAQPAPPSFYSDAQFEKNQSNWVLVLEKGKDVEDLIVWIENKAKAKLTSEQKAILRDVRIPAAPAELMATPEKMRDVRASAEENKVSWSDVCASVGAGADEILTEKQANDALDFIASAI